MEKNIQYRIYNILADSLLKEPRVNADNVNDHPFKLYNAYSRILDSSDPVSHRNLNALFYQIMETADLDDKEENCFLRYIVNVDFSRIFFRNLNAVNNKGNKTKAERIDAILKNIFDGNGKTRGIIIDFKDEKIRFVPFDKSGSMTRNSRITFIREEIKKELDKRLLVGFPFDKMPIDSSKYFAYRGLYLSDAKRIEPYMGTDRSMPINENTVIVIPDMKMAPEDKINVAAGMYTNTSVPDENGIISFKLNKFD